MWKCTSDENNRSYSWKILKFTQNDEKGIQKFILKLGALSHKFQFNIDVIDDVIKAK